MLFGVRGLGFYGCFFDLWLLVLGGSGFMGFRVVL